MACEQLDDLLLSDRGMLREVVEAGVVVRHQGEIDVAHAELPRQRHLGVLGHVDHIPTLGAEPPGLRSGRESRAGDDDHGPAVVHGETRLTAGIGGQGAEVGTVRVGHAHVSHLGAVEEGRLMARAGVIDELVAYHHVAWRYIAAETPDCARPDDPFHSERVQSPDVGSVVDAMGRNRVGAAVAGEEGNRVITDPPNGDPVTRVPVRRGQRRPFRSVGEFVEPRSANDADQGVRFGGQTAMVRRPAVPAVMIHRVPIAVPGNVEALMSQSVHSPAATPAGLDRWFAEQGPPLPIDLARSGAASLSVAELLGLAGESHDKFLSISLDYGAGRGGSRLVSAVRSSLGGSADAEVIIAGGAVEALLLLCIATADGGEVLVGTPTYGALLSAPAAAGRKVGTVSVWNPVVGLHFDDLAARITASTGMVVVNSPHNPTGAQASLDELDELAERCSRHGALLVVDEVARGTLDPGARSAVHSHGFAEGTTVVLGDVSKSLGLGGLRIGWLGLADAGLAAAVAAAKDGTTVASGTLSEHLAALALEHAPLLLRRITAAAQTNLRALIRFLADGGYSAGLIPPADGLVAFPAVPAPTGIDDLVASLRRRDVGVVPGSLFGESGRLRLGLGGRPDLFSEGLRRLRRALEGR